MSSSFAVDSNECGRTTLCCVSTSVISSLTQGRSYAAFVTDQFWFTDSLSVTAGARLERYDIDFQTVTLANTRTYVETNEVYDFATHHLATELVDSRAVIGYLRGAGSSPARPAAPPAASAAPSP